MILENMEKVGISIEPFSAKRPGASMVFCIWKVDIFFLLDRDVSALHNSDRHEVKPIVPQYPYCSCNRTPSKEATMV